MYVYIYIYRDRAISMPLGLFFVCAGLQLEARSLHLLSTPALKDVLTHARKHSHIHTSTQDLASEDFISKHALAGPRKIIASKFNKEVSRN